MTWSMFSYKIFSRGLSALLETLVKFVPAISIILFKLSVGVAIAFDYASLDILSWKSIPRCRAMMPL